MTTVLLIWLLEAGKLGWHSERWRKDYRLLAIHAACAVYMGEVVHPGFGMVMLCLIMASYTALWTTTEEANASWWGKKMPIMGDRWHCLSALSSFPVQIAALWGMDWYWWVMAGVGGQLIWMSPLRPNRWKGSKIERFYHWIRRKR